MQQKANEVVLLLKGEVVTYTDVKIIETEDGLYVKDSFKRGTTEEGEDIIQKRLTYYSRKDLLKIVWSEDALVEAVEEAVLSELIQDKFEHLMEMYDEDDDEDIVGSPKADRRDDPKFNPYNKPDKGE
jgi:DNA-binding cell septation regulator SpoVG